MAQQVNAGYQRRKSASLLKLTTDDSSDSTPPIFRPTRLAHALRTCLPFEAISTSLQELEIFHRTSIVYAMGGSWPGEIPAMRGMPGSAKGKLQRL